ncbi:MAG: hypothetical protein AAF447_17245 [Myxococcota bacterium]
MTYILPKSSRSRAILLPLATALITFASLGTARAQPGNIAQAYTHQIHEVVVTTPDFSATYHVLVTPPSATDPTLLGFDIVTLGQDKILENDPELVSGALPLIAVGSHSTQNDPELVTNDPELVTNDPELVTDSLRVGREYWFLSSSGSGSAPTGRWTLLLDRVGNDPELVTRVHDLLAHEAYLGSLPSDHDWAAANPALTSSWTHFSVDAVSGDGVPGPALGQLTLAVSMDASGTPMIPLVFSSLSWETSAAGAAISDSDYRGLTAPFMTLFGLINTVNPGCAYVPPSVSESQTAHLQEVAPGVPGYPDPTWFTPNP